MASKFYDVLGRKIAILVNEEKRVGNYSVQLSAVGKQLASGIYFYRMLGSTRLRQAQSDSSPSGSETFIQTMKLILMK